MSMRDNCQCRAANEWNGKPPVNQRNDDVLHVDVLVQICTRAKERIQGLQMELIWEDLQKNKCVSQPYIDYNLKVQCVNKYLHTIYIFLEVFVNRLTL